MASIRGRSAVRGEPQGPSRSQSLAPIEPGSLLKQAASGFKRGGIPPPSLSSLIDVMTGQPPAIRQGAVKELLKLLTNTTDLSKSDVKQVVKDLTPVVSANPPALVAPAKKQQKKKKRIENDPRITALYAKYPESNRGKDSPFAVELRAVRKELKQK